MTSDEVFEPLLGQDIPLPMGCDVNASTGLSGRHSGCSCSGQATDKQIGGDHYRKLGKYQPWEVLAHWLTPEELRGFAKGTAIAYLCRERDKGCDEDIRKAIHTLELYFHLAGNNP